MRGTASVIAVEIVVSGITPAGAGNRNLTNSSTKRTWDHPRGCGEQYLVLKRRFYGRGSPPRVRGTGSIHSIGSDAPRITPAGAGNRKRIRLPHCTEGDHPRGCGEQRCRHTTPSRSSGSPPRVRGTGARLIPHSWDIRITPAGAGNRFWPQNLRCC